MCEGRLLITQKMNASNNGSRAFPFIFNYVPIKYVNKQGEEPDLLTQLRQAGMTLVMEMSKLTLSKQHRL